MTFDSQGKNIFFLHIPKTGGTSVVSILENNFNAESICPKNLYYQLFEEGTNLSQFRLIHGHFGYWILKLLSETPKIMTILREPHELLLSYYDHQIRAFENNFLRLFTSKVSIDEIFNDQNYQDVFSNIQTRFLVADLDTDALRERFKSNNLTAQTFEKKGLEGIEIRLKFGPKILIKNEDEIFNVAKNRLEQFAFIGIFEKLEESLLLLYYKFGWYPLRAIPKRNVFPRKTSFEDLPKETREKIIQATKMDSRLYDYGIKLFDKRFSEMITFLKENYYEEKYKDFSFIDMIYDMLEKHYFFTNFGNTIPFYSEINFIFDQPLIGTGWHKHEFFDGSIFRWTGPENTSTIHFLLNKNKDLKIRITVLFTMTQEILDSLIFEVNDIVLKLNRTSESDKIILEGIIPSSILERNEKIITKIAFKVDQTVQPSAINPNSDDQRFLGIAFARIEIKP